MTTQDMRGVDRADVWFREQLAGTLTRSGNTTEFRYARQYLDAAPVPIASTLPLDDKPVVTHSGAVPPFFAGLLPEGRRLSALRHHVKTSADDELSLLLAVGADPVGAVSIVAEGSQPSPPEPALILDDQVDFTEILSQAGIVDPIALPGVQDKASARTIAVPVEGDVIVKISPPEFPQLVENEAACYSLLRNNPLRLPLSDVSVIHDRHGRSGLLVARFDRSPAANGIRTKYPVEDATQILGLWPSQKYSVSYEEVATAVAAVTVSPLLALRNIAFQIACAWLTGNGDLHAKNISVVDYGTGYQVSPLYDIPSTIPYGDTSLALPIQGRTDGLSVQRFRAFTSEIGLPPKTSESIIRAALTSTAHAFEVISTAADFDARRNRDLRRILYKRRSMWTD